MENEKEFNGDYMNWYKESTSKFNILTRTISSFFIKKIKSEIIKRDQIAENTGEDRAKRIYKRHNFLFPYKQRYINFKGIDTFLSVELQLLIDEEDHFNIGGWFLGLQGKDLRITLSLNIPYHMFNLKDLSLVKEELTVTIRHELEHLKEYIESNMMLEGTIEYDEPATMDYLFNPAEIRATAMSLKMFAEKIRKKNEKPNYEAIVDNYIYSYFSNFIEEKYIGTKQEQNLKEKYKKEILNYINFN